MTPFPASHRRPGRPPLDRRRPAHLEEGAMQRLWSVLTVGGALWLSVSSVFALEFSAEQTTRKGAQSMSGKIYFQPDRWRVEMASPDGPKGAIHRLDKPVTWPLLPGRKHAER